MVLQWFSPAENLVFPGVREQIVHESFTAARLSQDSAQD